MSAEYTPSLAVNFIWNPSDSNLVTPILNSVRTSFARDKNRPFSRGLNIPLFFFSSQNTNEIPFDKPSLLAKRNIIFVFTSVNTVGRKEWKKYIEELPTSPMVSIVPIAIDKDGLGHGGSLNGLNCIRVYGWPVEHTEQYAIVSLAHEVYRHGCIEIDPNDPGKKSSITIFLSHAKAGDTGKLHAEQIMRFIDNTNMNRFFDATEITPGLPFDQEIEKYIPNSTLVAIASDAYSSRYWCQREILGAKQNKRPIVVMNCLNEYEDRIFPAASNVPCIRVSSENPIKEADILRVLSASILETIRYTHAMECLEAYKSAGWIDDDCELTARPPEIRQVLALRESGKTKVCYPEPPIYSDEADWHHQLEIKTFTPLWNLTEESTFSNVRVGISISEVIGDNFFSNHIHPDHIVRLAQDIARHLLARSSTLLYSGDLRPDGFTEFILDEAKILKERIGSKQAHIENHLAWPLYISDPEIVSWRARYREVMDTIEHAVPSDIINDLDTKTPIPPNNTQNSYIWSRCLTEMREKSVSSSHVRICVGGKTFGYKGKMPGVLEEIILAIDKEKPIFLLGAYGGIVEEVCKVILHGDTPDTLTENWQISHNAGYSDLQELANQYGHACNYDTAISSLKKIKISELASRCGLNEDEYKRVMTSPFSDECIHLILKGMSALKK